MKFTSNVREVFLVISLIQENESEIAYNIVKSLTQCEENIDRIVYGIQISGNGESSQIKDISSDKQKVEQLLHKLKKLEVRPKFLYEIVEDFLCEYY